MSSATTPVRPPAIRCGREPDGYGSITTRQLFYRPTPAAFDAIVGCERCICRIT